MQSLPHTGDRDALPRELTEFLIELSIALQKFAIYPAGHPMLGTTVERLERRLLPLLDTRDTLSLGVAHDQLVIEGVATDATHAVLRDLAQRLHRHHLGALKIFRGVGSDELREMLGVVGMELSKDATPLGLQPAGSLPAWRNVRLYALAYEHLELLDDESSSDDKPSERRSTGGARAARLWVGLARAALAGREATIDESQVHEAHGTTAPAATPLDASAQGETAPLTPEQGAASTGATAEGGEDETAGDPLAIARAIDEHHREPAYDQVIVGYMLQIADELKGADGRDATVLRSRVSRMVGGMRPDTLRTLLSMGNDAAQRRKFVLDATQGMAVDAVVELVRAAADASNQTISHSMLRMLSKLAAHAGEATGTRRADADAALRENVRTLVNQWTLEDPNPEGYREVLEGMAKSKPSPVARASTMYPVEDERLLQIALEIGIPGESTWRALEGMIARRRLSAVIALLDRAPRPNIVAQVWAHIATTQRLRDALNEREPDWHPLERVVARLGLGAADVLLDALDSGIEARRQTQIITLLVKLGGDVGAAAARRLPQATPEIQAQLLGLLGRLGGTPQGFVIDEWTRNRAPGVRREAIKLLFKEPARREHGIMLGLMDTDDRTVLLALNEASSSCPRSVVPILMNRVDRDDIPAPLRALAIRTVASVQAPDVVEWVLRFVMVGRKRFFGGERLAAKSPELIAALAALGIYWQHDARAAETLARASRHTDAEIRSAAQSTASPPQARTSA